MSAADTTLLTRQREMLLQKLDEFERTNKALRRLLREQQATEVLSDYIRRKLKDQFQDFFEVFFFQIEVNLKKKQISDDKLKMYKDAWLRLNNKDRL